MSPAGQSLPGASPAKLLARPASRDRRVGWLAAAVLAAALLLVYRPVWNAQFIWDDDAHLTAHPSIVGPLGLKEVWTTAAANYFPLVLTTFWALNKAFGLNPLVFHLVGVALHIACTLMLWAVLRRLRVPGAWLGAALWGLHPVQVESVAWVSEIINTQSGLFFLLAIWFGCRWLAPDSGTAAKTADYAAAFLCAVGAMLSKPSTVMLPVVLALCAWWLRGRLRWRDAIWLAPFFAFALATSAWAIWEQKVHQRAVGDDWAYTLPERIVIAGKAVWFYAGKLIWPHPLSFIYPRWKIAGAQWASWLPALTAAFAMAVLAWQAWQRGGAWRAAFFAAAFHVVLLFPVLGFFNVYFFRYSFVADHFQYLASMGLLALLGATLKSAADALRPRMRLAIHLTCAVALLVAATLSWRHARLFVNDETLWRATLRTNPECILAHNNLGVLLAEAGNFDEAVRHYRRALELNPRVAETHASLAQALMRLPGGATGDALRHLEIALQLNPELGPAHSSYARLLAGISGRRDEAIRHFEISLRLRPDNADDHSSLSVLLATVPGRLPDAIAHAQTAVRLKPDVAEAHFNLAKLLSRTREGTADAIRHYETAVRLKPDHVKAHIELGLAYANLQRFDDAIRQYEAALRIDPRSALAHNNLAIALAQSGRREDARRHFEQAIEIDPNYADARNNLKLLLANP